LAEASDLRSMYLTMTDLVSRREWLTDLLEICVEVGIVFAKAQIEAGAHIIGLGDAVCSQISPKMYRQFALPYEQRIFTAVHEMGGITRLHICGNTTRLLPDMLQSGADIIDLDWMVDLEKATQLFDDQVAICGNFDPVAVILQGTPGTVRTSVRNCIQKGGKRLFSGAGCEIPDKTPDENLLAQYQALCE
jgi:uroporphyrinogen decarboxylase